MKKSKKRLGLLLMAAVGFLLVQCGEDADGGAGGNSDARAVLIAGDSPVTVDALDIKTDDTTVVDSKKMVFFTGAAELELTEADFEVTSDDDTVGGAVYSVNVADDTVTIVVAFDVNTSPSAKIYNVVIASTSERVKGDANVRVIHNGINGEGPSVLYVSSDGSDENNGLFPETPFKTLAYAYAAALAADPVRNTIVVLSDLDVVAAIELTGTPAGAITITGDTATPRVLTRTSGFNDSVVKVTGGAKVVFKNIKINGRPEKTGVDEPVNETVYNRALFIEEAEVTLEANTHLVGKSLNDSETVDYVEYLNGGGAAFIKSGKLTMNDGLISDSAAYYGGGVFVYRGLFIMNNGIIRDNVALGDENLYGGGGGVCVEGNRNADLLYWNSDLGRYVLPTEYFIMTGGAIRNNIAKDGLGGGGVIVVSGTFRMSDNSVISGNNAKSIAYPWRAGVGGGVLICDFSINAGFSLEGGVISGNTADRYGGGLCLTQNELQFSMTGGTIYGVDADDASLRNTAELTEEGMNPGDGGVVGGAGDAFCFLSATSYMNNAINKTMTSFVPTSY
jgi:hypothetical protein